MATEQVTETNSPQLAASSPKANGSICGATGKLTSRKERGGTDKAATAARQRSLFHPTFLRSYGWYGGEKTTRREREGGGDNGGGRARTKKEEERKEEKMVEDPEIRTVDR